MAKVNPKCLNLQFDLDSKDSTLLEMSNFIKNIYTLSNLLTFGV